MDVFEDEIKVLERQRLGTIGAKGPVVLYGSSTIRLWDTCREDLAPLPIINRGFGGSTLHACAEAFDRLVRPLKPSVLLIYAGDNDLEQGAHPEDLVEDFRSLIHQARKGRRSRVPICMVAIKPSPSRWKLGERIRQANRALEEEANQHADVWFLDIIPSFLDGDLRPRKRLFQDDLLHLSPAGYKVFAGAVAYWLVKVEAPTSLNPQGFEEVPASRLLPRTVRLHRGTLHGGSNHDEISREYHVWHSPRLGRDMELLVFGHAGERMLVFPSRMERFFEWENRGMVHACHEAIASGRLQLWCLDSVDAESFFAFDKPPSDRITRHYQYESYVLEEVLPLTLKLNPTGPLGATGCSLGAFHAAAISLRHPRLFQRLVALSGRFDLSRSFGEDYPDLFTGYREKPLYYLMPTHFLPNLQDAVLLAKLREMEIILAVGEGDVFRQSNEDLSRILWDRGVSHHLRLWVGQSHRFRAWRQMARLYL